MPARISKVPRWLSGGPRAHYGKGAGFRVSHYNVNYVTPTDPVRFAIEGAFFGRPTNSIGNPSALAFYGEGPIHYQGVRVRVQMSGAAYDVVGSLFDYEYSYDQTFEYPRVWMHENAHTIGSHSDARRGRLLSSTHFGLKAGFGATDPTGATDNYSLVVFDASYEANAEILAGSYLDPELGEIPEYVYAGGASYSFPKPRLCLWPVWKRPASELLGVVIGEKINRVSGAREPLTGNLPLQNVSLFWTNHHFEEAEAPCFLNLRGHPTQPHVAFRLSESLVDLSGNFSTPARDHTGVYVSGVVPDYFGYGPLSPTNTAEFRITYELY